MTLRPGFVLGIICLLLGSSAQAADMTVPQEYGKLILAAQGIETTGTGLFGDETGLYTGATEFRVTDIDIPGTGLVPMRLGRRYRVEDRSNQEVERPGYAFADWQLDLPHLHGVFAKWQRWVIEGGGRCSATGSPAEPPDVFGHTGVVFRGSNYWAGNHLYVPGAGDQELLAYSSSENPNQPASEGPYAWATQGQWFFSCLPTLASGNGYAGEGFLAIDPQGTRYWFDWMVVHGAQRLRMSETQAPVSTGSDGDHRLPITDILDREEVHLYPTRIEDRFGNEVILTWSGTRLMQMRASDGRTIDITYAGNVVDTATDGSQIWSYQYDSARFHLQSAQRPDGSAWGYSMGALEWVHPTNTTETSCDVPVLPVGVTQPSASVSITHPSGALGTFVFRPTQHGRAAVPRTCHAQSDGSQYASFPRYFFNIALVGKTISGPGLSTPLVWTFDYGSAQASWSHECGAGCATTKTVTVTGPDDYVRHTFGTRHADDEGRLLKRETGSSAANILRTETLVHQTASAGLAYPLRVGLSPMSRTDGMAGRLIPQKSHTISQQGRQFSWSVQPADFDAFARPLRVTRTGTEHRTDRTEYHDNRTRWVLGQVGKRVCESSSAAGTGCTNTVVEETTFDPITALPLSTWRFGQLQQTLAWNTTAPVASGQRGTLDTLTDGNHQVTTYGNWRRGIAQSIQYPPTPESPGGATRTAVVNARGEITSVTDEMGATTGYGYDAMGRINLITYPTGDSTAWAPTTRTFEKVDSAEFGIPAGHWRLTETTGSHSKETYYDALWRPVLTRERDTGDATTTRYVKRDFDSQGRETFVSWPSASSAPTTGTWTEYDALGRTTAVSQNSELGLLTATTEYLANFRTRTTNPRGYQTTTSYQVFDQPGYDAPISLAEPGGVTTTISRDAYGKPIAITRSGTYSPPTGGTENLSLTRRFVYDGYQRLCKRIDPESGATLMDHDAVGNLAWSARSASLTSPASCQTGSVGASIKSQRSYDARNRLTAITHPAGTASEGYSHYADGALHTATTSDGGTWSYDYNTRRLPTRETLSLGARTFAIDYTYTSLGQVSTLTYPSGLAIGFDPDALGQPQQAGSYAGSATWHPDGQLAGFTYGNGLIHSQSLTARGLPLRIRDRTAGGQSRLDYSYSYDKHGNPRTITDGVNASESRTLVYDARDRMISATAPNLYGEEIYEYDALDNVRRLAVYPDGLGGYVMDYRYRYDGANRLTGIDDPGAVPQWVFDHTPLGETLSRNGHGSTWGYQWNAVGRMTRAERQAPVQPLQFPMFPLAAGLPFGDGFETHTPGLVTTWQTHAYDAHGHRTLSTRNTGTTRTQVYSRAGQLLYTEDTQDNQRIDYIHLGGKLVAQRSRPLNTNTATTTWHHTDIVQSANVETSASGTQTRRTLRMPYGSPYDGQYREGPGFAGHVTDTQTNLTYMQQRYYDPVALRFLSPDPVDVSGTDGSNFNRYWYAANNPMKYRDPDGREVQYAIENRSWILIPQETPESDNILMSPSAIMQREAITDQALRKVFSTVRGEQLRTMVEKSGKKLRINLNDQNHQRSLPGSFEMDFDPSRTKPVQTTAGRINATPERIIAHEAGHAITGTEDTGPNRMDNINQNENPIMHELNQPERTEY